VALGRGGGQNPRKTLHSRNLIESAGFSSIRRRLRNRRHAMTYKCSAMLDVLMSIRSFNP
jgi:hypothetical protein